MERAREGPYANRRGGETDKDREGESAGRDREKGGVKERERALEKIMGGEREREGEKERGGDKPGARLEEGQ